jgi:uncharacterized membrane protein
MFDLTPLTVLMRWLHLASAAILVGGMVFARLAMTRSLGSLSPETRDEVAGRAAVAYRPLAIAAVICLVLSGTYQFYSSSGHSLRHNILFGLKMALVLHVFSAAILIVQPRNPRRVGMMTGVAVSGTLIILISALLRQFY